jgi:hypothetical protein
MIDCSNSRSHRLERAMQAGLGNSNCLLLHNLINSHSINLVYLVKLINTEHSPAKGCLQLLFELLTFQL